MRDLKVVEVLRTPKALPWSCRKVSARPFAGGFAVLARDEATSGRGTEEADKAFLGFVDHRRFGGVGRVEYFEHAADGALFDNKRLGLSRSHAGYHHPKEGTAPCNHTAQSGPPLGSGAAHPVNAPALSPRISTISFKSFHNTGVVL